MVYQLLEFITGYFQGHLTKPYIWENKIFFAKLSSNTYTNGSC